MFNKSSPAPQQLNSNSVKSQTIVGHSVKVEGDLSSDEDIIVNGDLNGSIKTSKNLTIGENAKIEADISTGNAVISGSVMGNIDASGKIEMTETSKVSGDIKTEILSIASGAIFNGHCSMGEKRSGKLDGAKPEE